MGGISSPDNDYTRAAYGVGAPFTAERGRSGTIRRFASEFIEFCLTHRDSEINDPYDDYRVVQRMIWFLLAPPERAVPGFSDNPALDFTMSSLMTAGGEVTPLGQSISDTLRRLRADASK